MPVRPTNRIDEAIRAAFVIPSPRVGEVLDFPAVFGNPRPVSLEVGFGKAGFLVRAAEAFPEQNWLGVDLRSSLAGHAARRLHAHGLRNARVLHGDAHRILRDHVPPGSLLAVHLYYPDPWWKRRHRKRRLYTTDFFAAIERALGTGARLHIASDVPAVFASMLGAAATIARLARAEGEPPPDCLARIGASNFESKAAAGGRTPLHAGFVKLAGDDRAS
jgi:tRNA (guanine-N7-)-methyltransferase